MLKQLLFSDLALLLGHRATAQTTLTGDYQIAGKLRRPCATPSTCTGPLGINTLTLAVGGKIGARGGVYVVNYGGTWPDYVFSPTYRLRPLAEVARFVEAHHHLPDVPSAAQVQAEGIELASMNAVLLQKIEELTLHLIEMEATNKELAKRVTQLEATR